MSIVQSEIGDFVVEANDETVWVHSALTGLTVARFGRLGIDVHNAAADGCLDCSPGTGPGGLTSFEDWRRFTSAMQRHHHIELGEHWCPKRIR